MPRTGLDRKEMLAVASGIVDAEGLEALTFARLASELSIRPPSLYNHFAGVDGLLDALRLEVLTELFQRVQAAMIGRSEKEAFLGFAHEQRRYAREHPELHILALPTLIGKNAELNSLGDKFMALLSAPLRKRRYSVEELHHIIRSFRAGVVGFIELERRGGFGLATDTEQSFDYMLDVLWTGVEARHRPIPA